MKKVGLFFGSFNPVHVGHLIIANTMLQLTDMEEVWLVVSPHNPLKQRGTLLADYHRMAMLREAVDDNYKLRACDVELHLPVPSYTCLTLATLHEKYPDREFCLIMGSDNLTTFDRWRNYQYIVDNHKIYVYPRQGHDGGEWLQHPNVEMIDVPIIDISSSYIRNMISEGKSVQYLVTPPVYKYLTEMHFYEKGGCYSSDNQ